MSTVVKKLFYAIVFSTILYGCQPQTYKRISFGSFNDETYVWEGFQFTTNQVEEVK